MGSVGLLYVGVLLFLNGTMLLGWVDATGAAPLTIFAGFLQVVTPTYLIINAGGDEIKILAAAGLYLFGFTYLHVGWNLLGNLEGSGQGMFALLVAAVACSVISFPGGDPVFGVTWSYWSFLWLLFFLLLGRKQEGLGKHAGAVAAVQGCFTRAIPAFLLPTGHLYIIAADAFAILRAAFAVVVFGALFVGMRQRTTTTTPRPATEPRPVRRGSHHIHIDRPRLRMGHAEEPVPA